MSTNRIAAWIEHRTSLVLAVFSIGYIALMFHFAPRRPMWIDEYLTFYLARLPLSDVWNVLLTGAESHPPTFLYLTHWSMKLFGSGHFALRLPAILGFVLMEI